MSASLKGPEGLKDSECEKGAVTHRPPIPYVPPTDLLAAKENSESLKVKLPDGTVLTMSIYSSGNPEEYLAHIIAVLRLIMKKGLSMMCRKKSKELETVASVLEDLRKREGSEEPNALKAEREQSLEMFKKVKKEYDTAVASTYELLRNLLSGDAQTQWDRIDREMHECDSWTGVNGVVTEGRRPRSYTAFKDCVELHKLTVFTYDAAERQRYYMQQSVRKPVRATIRQYVTRMGVLNDYLKHLPTLKNSPKAVATTKKGNVPFSEADLASLILSTVPVTWQNQYNLNHQTVPESPRTLLQDLENIERVMSEKLAEKLRAQGRASAAAKGDSGGKGKKRESGGRSERVPKKARTEKFCQRCKTHGGPHQTHNTNECRRYDKDGKPTSASAGKPSGSGRKPYKKFGGDDVWLICQPCSRPS